MSLVGALRVINRKLGSPARRLGPVREFVEPRLRWRSFERSLEQRRRKYPDRAFPSHPRPDIAARIEADGYVVLPGFMDPGILHRLAAEMDEHLDRGTELMRVSDDAARSAGDLAPARAFLSEEDLRRGQSHFRARTNYASIANPLATTRHTAQLAFHHTLLDIAQSYLGAPPALGGLNLRKSFCNPLPAFDTLHFHVDPDSPKFLKAFLYLNDVDMEGGPFCYVRGSHRKRFRGWLGKQRWTEDEIAGRYGREAITYLTARVGDVVIADTNGFHRGTKITGADRRMLTLDYVVHPEYEGAATEAARLPRAVFESLDARQRAAADFLSVV
jgi:hypothetical protein